MAAICKGGWITNPLLWHLYGRFITLCIANPPYSEMVVALTNRFYSSEKSIHDIQDTMAKKQQHMAWPQHFHDDGNTRFIIIISRRGAKP
jgi:hypothetical protein